MNGDADNPFATFWQAGNEGSDHTNRAQTALSMNQSIRHLAKVAEVYALRQQLVRATIAGGDAILQVSPDAHFLHCDPIIHVVPPEAHPEWAQWASDLTSAHNDSLRIFK